MKQITYEIRGLVIETMLPAIQASCESIAGVRNLRVTVVDDDTARLTFMVDDDLTPELESSLESVMRAKGLELVTPPTVMNPAFAPAPPVAPAPAPKPASKPVPAPVPEKGRKISLTAALSTVIVAVVLAVLLTFSLTTAYMKGNTPSVKPETTEDAFGQIEILDRLFRSATVLDLDEETLMAGILKGYVAATGDVYAEYYTAAEYQAQLDSNDGKKSGIGVNVVSQILTIDDEYYEVITIISVYPNSPAEKAGILPGDCIMYVGVGEDKVSVTDIGYDEALDRLAGDVGTECAFTVLRPPADHSSFDAYEMVDIVAIRDNFVTRSVLFRRYAEDETVGVIRITGFDNTTRDQFIEAVETLKAEGCTSFVLDLRGNPGGLLTSVEDVLVLFLNENDTIITTKNASGRETTTKLTCNKAGQVTCGTGTMTRADIGKYRNLKFSVLVNESTASAAELFTSNIRDYELGTVVGITTYGKGCGQTTYSLARYGYEGALKLTTFYYYPPSGEGYDGIGITPHVEVQLTEEAMNYFISLLPDNLDPQLAAAVASMK